MKVAARKAREQIESLLAAWGMEADLVRVTADAMVETDLAGVDSHGISMLMDYEKFKTAGKLNVKARPKVVKDGPVIGMVDADAGLGHPAAVMGMDLAIAKAKQMGVGVVTVFNSHHFGAAGYYARRASAAGLVGMVTSATRAIAMVPTRASVPVLGTNPIAFAAPAKRNAPFCLDMATTTVANNKIKVYELNGKTLPPGWILDEHGEPVTDPKLAREIIYERGRHKGGGQTPIGGTPEMSSHKGYGLGLMVHILGGTLSGASFSPIRILSQKPNDPDRLGHFFMAIDPKAFRPEGAFEDDLDAVIDVLHGTPPVDPALPVLVPGDPERESRERRLREGIPMPDSLLEKIEEICRRSGVPYILK
ncbi:MAG TPA: Ldh family oxidoreductase [Burkholderiales bacterium]|jgi:LDH2 family malate/lactate/ureidoglycolate dehydrogenase|nr:Ldh family oxidoreductase [Burkholderiales bacterium]